MGFLVCVLNSAEKGSLREVVVGRRQGRFELYRFIINPRYPMVSDINADRISGMLIQSYFYMLWELPAIVNDNINFIK